MTPRTRPLTTQAMHAQPGFLDYVRPDLEAIERCLEAEISSEVHTVHNLAGYVLESGGKRLRPALVAVAARCVDECASSERIAVLGTAMELIHMATLLHDDVVDDTSFRRGRPTASAVFGNGVAVLTGDFLLARAMWLMAGDGDVAVMRIMSQITIEMSEGEVMEILATGNPNISREHYYDIVSRKTAVFLDGCCRSGAVVAGAAPEQTALLGDAGRCLGMAFQIADDVLDYTGDQAQTGKPVGSDLRDGRATLPFLLALASAGPADREVLLGAFGKDKLPEGSVARVVGIMKAHEVFDSARAAARDFVDRAAACLEQLPHNPGRQCFHDLTEYVVNRKR